MNVGTLDGIDPTAFRDVLGQYPTGVSVITAVASDGEHHALVVGTFTSVSLDPPLVGFLPMKSSYVFSKMRSAPSFAVNVLAHDQEALCRQLTRPVQNKLDGVAWSPSRIGGAPLLEGALAHVVCTFHSILNAGDHFIVLGTVETLSTRRTASPLIYLQGGFGGFAPPAFLAATDHELAMAVNAVQRFHRELVAVATELDACVEVFAPIGADAAMVGFAATESTLPRDLLGARYPLIPPFGEHFIAFSGEDEECWFTRAQGMGEGDQAHYRSRLQLVREQLWTYTLADPELSSDLEEAVRAYADHPLPVSHTRLARSAAEARSNYPTRTPGDDETKSVATISAPVRSTGGAAKFVLRMNLSGRSLKGRDIRTLGNRLVQHANSLADKIVMNNGDDPLELLEGRRGPKRRSRRG